MKKLLIILLFCFISIPVLKAQQQYYNWHISAGQGAMGYYGDLSHTISSAKISVPAYQLSIGRNISPSLALTLQGSYGRISGNDRARDWNGALRTDNMNFSRGLNFQTDIRNASLLLSYRLNNGMVISQHAAVAPYLYGGVGVTDFTVFGDLYGENGQQYYYWSDNTVRNQPEPSANEATAQVIGQDGNFETRLSGLATEQNYPTQVISIPAGVGVKFRLSDRFSANLQAGANFTFSGYLDDVNGDYRNEYTSSQQAYAANPTNVMRDRRGDGGNDLYLAAFLSVAYHFNFKKKSFTPPVVYTGYKSPQTPVALQSKESDDANLHEEELNTPQPNNNAAVASAPEIGPSPPKQTTASQQNLNRNNTMGNQSSQPERQTVDINLRIMLEDGKMVVDTVSRQQTDTRLPNDFRKPNESRQKGDNSAVNRPGQRIRSLQEANNPADIEFNNTDTRQIDIPSRQIQVDASVPPRKKQMQTTSSTALEDDVRRLRTELDSLKNSGNNTPITSSMRPNTAPASKTEPKEQNAQRRDNAQNTYQAPPQPNTNTQAEAAYEKELTALRQEVAQLRQDLNGYRNRNKETPPQQVVVSPQRERRSSTGVTATPLNTGRQYDEKEMKQLENELAGIRSQLDQLRTQKKIEPDTTIDNKIDSLMNLVSTIQTTQSTQTGQNSLNQEEENRRQTQLTDSLQRQILSLNQSLKSMEKGLAAGIDTLSMGVPYTALGSTVVYYDVNMAQLKEADKQRLSILGRKLKAEPSVLLLIKGFTDQTGNADYNLKLSQKRAENVKNYFINQMGVQPEQILINYFGQQKSSSTAGNAHDRRVELELFREN